MKWIPVKERVAHAWNILSFFFLNNIDTSHFATIWARTTQLIKSLTIGYVAKVRFPAGAELFSSLWNLDRLWVSQASYPVGIGDY